MRFIGDVHAKFNRYLEIIRDIPESTQVGDFGIGFKRTPSRGSGHKFIRGNHDNPKLAKATFGYIRDGFYDGTTFHCGGAYSIDQHIRTQGVDYWEDEELTYSELFELAGEYEVIKPKVMVTHDCPSEVALELFGELFGTLVASRTSNGLQTMFDAHKPKLWVFGHWHHSIDRVIKGTRFICLAELEYKDIDLSTL